MYSDQYHAENGSHSVQNTAVERKGKRKLGKASVKMIAATLCIAGAVATWIAMAEALQKLNKEYNKPYFMIWFVHSSYSLLYVGWAAWRYFPYCFSGRQYQCNRIGVGFLDSFKRLAVWSGILALIAVLSGFAWYLSLTRTNIPANTAIYQCSSAIVFVLSVPLLKERVTVLKVFCVLSSIGGVFMVAFFSTSKDCPQQTNITNATTLDYHDKQPCQPDVEKSTPLGYVALTISVITYALFETLYKKFGTKNDDPAATLNGLRVLGYIGVHSLLWMWPPIIVLHYIGFAPLHEPFELPSMELFGLLVLNCFLDIIFNACLLVCIALSSPLYASVGTITAIPVSVVVDWIVHHFLPSWQSFVGIVLILIGFIGFVISEFLEIRREKRHKKQLNLKNTTTSKSSSSDVEEEEPLLNEKRPSEVYQNSGMVWRKRLINFLI